MADWWEGLCGPVDRSTRRRLRDLGETTLHLPGTVIVEEGDAADGFYLILEGAVDVEIEGHVVNRLRAGEFFGEVAMLASLDRTATVRAGIVTRIHRLDHREMRTLMDASPKAASHISRAAVSRIAALSVR